MKRAILLSLTGCSFGDHEPAYWTFQRENLRRQFLRSVRSRIASGEIRHLSVFAIAPQPLLIELGRLLSDIPACEVFQLRREPQTWRWAKDGTPIDMSLTEPSVVDCSNAVGLKLALSATISDDRVFDALGRHVPIWSLAAAEPHNDILSRTADLATFRTLVRSAFDRIKARHGEGAEIHVFPALPVSAAVEVGRVWMPKADLPIVIYDQDRARGGFVFALSIPNGGE